MLPDTTGRFGLTQIFDWDGFPSHAPMSSSQIQAEAPNYDTVWGSFYPQTWASTPNDRALLSRYTLPVEDNNSMSGHDLAWWQANNPTWILYACDSSGNPTKDLAWSGTGFTDVPLAFYEPQVQQYLIPMFVSYLQANPAYKALALDNTDLLNYLLGGNPNFGQSTKSGEYGCGTYDANGNFVRRYGAQGQTYNRNDPTFAQDMVTFVQQTASALHAAGFKLLINHPLYNHPTDSNESAMIAAVDATIDERGFTDYGHYQNASRDNLASLVNSTIEWAQYAQQHHVAFLITDYLCDGYAGKADWNGNAPCSNDPSTLPASQVDWALATYALVNMGGADVYITPMSGANYSYRSEYSQQYGAPCGPYTAVSGYMNVYQRRFQKGMAIINANEPGNSATVTLPSGKSYTDIERGPVTSPLTVNGADAYMLLLPGGGGCS